MSGCLKQHWIGHIEFFFLSHTFSVHNRSTYSTTSQSEFSDPGWCSHILELGWLRIRTISQGPLSCRLAWRISHVLVMRLNNTVSCVILAQVWGSCYVGLLPLSLHKDTHARRMLCRLLLWGSHYDHFRAGAKSMLATYCWVYHYLPCKHCFFVSLKDSIRVLPIWLLPVHLRGDRGGMTEEQVFQRCNPTDGYRGQHFSSSFFDLIFWHQPLITIFPFLLPGTTTLSSLSCSILFQMKCRLAGIQPKHILQYIIHLLENHNDPQLITTGRTVKWPLV